MRFFCIIVFSFIATILFCSFPTPQIEYAPEHYICYKALKPINIDGIPDEKSWENVPWTNRFVDIEGDLKPAPFQHTRAKMLWDEDYFYVAAKLEETHIAGFLNEHDNVIFYDDDFEVFIDPDCDTHNYYELEMNALNTTWDLLLTQAYKDNGKAVDHWNIAGLKTAVHIEGTLNNPSDKDKYWTVEIAIPWNALEECARHSGFPEDNEIMKVNFSRVDWQYDIVNGKYVKKKNLPENNWVWSPQGLIAMHYPERWGVVQFSHASAGEKVEPVFEEEPELRVELFKLYYMQKEYESKHGHFNKDFKPYNKDIIVIADKYNFIYGLEKGGKVWYVNNKGRIWSVSTGDKE